MVGGGSRGDMWGCAGGGWSSGGRRRGIWCGGGISSGICFGSHAVCGGGGNGFWRAVGGFASGVVVCGWLGLGGVGLRDGMVEWRSGLEVGV